MIMQCIAFGAGTQGQLGNGLLADSYLPTAVQVADTHTHLSVACGGNHSLCLAGEIERQSTQQQAASVTS